MVNPISDRMMLFPGTIKIFFCIFLLNLPGFRVSMTSGIRSVIGKHNAIKYMKINHEELIYEAPGAEIIMLEAEGVLAASDGNFEILEEGEEDEW